MTWSAETLHNNVRVGTPLLFMEWPQPARPPTPTLSLAMLSR